MAVVTVARQEGAWGEAIAAQVAERLGARLYDDDLLTTAATRSGVPEQVLVAMDERGRSVWRYPADLWRLVPVPLPDVDHAQHVPPITTYPPTGPVAKVEAAVLSAAYWAAEAYRQLFAETVQAVVREAPGHVVLVGRGGQCALGPQPGTVHVLVVAPRSVRIERVQRERGGDRADAAAHVRRSDRDRRSYHQQTHSVDWLDPTLYDLAINTGRMSIDLATDLIVTAAQAAPPFAASVDEDSDHVAAAHAAVASAH